MTPSGGGDRASDRMLPTGEWTLMAGAVASVMVRDIRATEGSTTSSVVDFKGKRGNGAAEQGPR